jgi:hypothetical protein
VLDARKSCASAPAQKPNNRGGCKDVKTKEKNEDRRRRKTLHYGSIPFYIHQQRQPAILRGESMILNILTVI